MCFCYSFETNAKTLSQEYCISIAADNEQRSATVSTLYKKPYKRIDEIEVVKGQKSFVNQFSGDLYSYNKW